MGFIGLDLMAGLLAGGSFGLVLELFSVRDGLVGWCWILWWVWNLDCWAL